MLSMEHRLFSQPKWLMSYDDSFYKLIYNYWLSLAFPLDKAKSTFTNTKLLQPTQSLHLIYKLISSSKTTTAEINARCKYVAQVVSTA